MSELRCRPVAFLGRVIVFVMLWFGGHTGDAGAQFYWSDLVGERVRLRGVAPIDHSVLAPTLSGELQAIRADTLVLAIDERADTAMVLVTPNLMVDRWQRVGGRGWYIFGGVLLGGGAGGALGYALIDEDCSGPAFSCLESAVSSVFFGVVAGGLAGGFAGSRLAEVYGRRGWVAVRPTLTAAKRPSGGVSLGLSIAR